MVWVVCRVVWMVWVDVWVILLVWVGWMLRGLSEEQGAGFYSLQRSCEPFKLVVQV